MACVGRFVLERAVDSDRQFVDANAGWRRACERWLEGRYHRFCGGFQSLDSAALYARDRGAAHFGRIRVHGGWSVDLLKGKHSDFAMKTVRIGAVVGIVASCAMIVTAHASAVEVSEEQPTKLAMMEGMYNDEVPPLYAFGWVDEESQQVITPFAIPGGTSFLATGTWDTEYAGLNSLVETEKYGEMNVADMPVNLVFQSYHLMVAMYGLIMLTAILAIAFSMRGGRIATMRWLQKLLIVSPLFPFIAIQVGWITAEVGRQPWVVYPSTSGPDGVSLLTNNAISQAVSAPELLLTLALFAVVYVFLFIGWVRVISHFIKRGPVDAVAAVESAAGGSACCEDLRCKGW